MIIEPLRAASFVYGLSREILGLNIHTNANRALLDKPVADLRHQLLCDATASAFLGNINPLQLALAAEPASEMPGYEPY
jgi:hypothetical protein